jgi:hypothetical protein
MASFKPRVCLASKPQASFMAENFNLLPSEDIEHVSHKVVGINAIGDIYPKKLASPWMVDPIDFQRWVQGPLLRCQ